MRLREQYLVVLVELTAEGDGEVARCSAGDCTGGIEGFAALVGAPALAYLHVLEARLHTGGKRAGVFTQSLHLNGHSSNPNVL